MTTMQADVLSPVGTPPTSPFHPGHARYRLAPNLEVIQYGPAGTLVSRQPLLAMRLNTVGTALLSGLSTCRSRSLEELTARVPALSPMDAAVFLDGLARRRMVIREPTTPARWPSVLIIVAAHGRPAATLACVQSLLTLRYPRDHVDIMVVDDASDPPLGRSLAGLPVRVLRLDENAGQSAARNLAAVEAEAELLAFIDNDCTAVPDWLCELVPHFNDPGIAAVGGRVVAPLAAGPVAAFEAARSPLDMGSNGGPVGPREAVAYLPTCNLIVRRDVLLARGGFAADMRIGEDVDFIWRVVEGGGRIHYTPTGMVTHDHRVQLLPLLRRRADYASSEADLQRRHPAQGRIMHVPCAGLLAMLALTALSVAWPLGVALIAAAAGMIMAELAGKGRRLAEMGVALSRRTMVASVMRGHIASLYHLGCDVTRYYGVPLACIAVIWSPLLPAAAVLLLAAPVGDHIRLKPRLALPAFIGLFWLEMAAYQWGVWRGCVARRCWRPLLPTIRWRR